nr:hypothetical protein CFP56_75242 [Quercus suber]
MRIEENGYNFVDHITFFCLIRLLKLRHDVSTCEYEDVRVMWEMLKRSETEQVIPEKSKKRSFWNIFDWARSAKYGN